MSFPRAVHPVGERKDHSPLLGTRVRRYGGTTAGQPFGEAAPGRKENLHRGGFRAGEGATRSAADAVQGETTRPDSALADGSGDEYQEGGAGADGNGSGRHRSQSYSARSSSILSAQHCWPPTASSLAPRTSSATVPHLSVGGVRFHLPHGFGITRA